MTRGEVAAALIGEDSMGDIYPNGYVDSLRSRIDDLKKAYTVMLTTFQEQVDTIDELEAKINLAHACLNNRNEMILSMKGENQKLNAVLDTIAKASHIGDGSTAISIKGKPYSCQEYARTRGGSDESK